MKHNYQASIVAAQSGKKYQFICDDKEDILSAGLRAGVPLHYGCRNGNCGKCKAYLLSGDLKKLAFYDYQFSHTQKAQNMFLMCHYAATCNISIRTEMQNEIKHIAVQHINAKAKEIKIIGDDLCILKLKMPRSNNLTFIAGQDASLSFKDHQSLNYPIASCPCEHKFIEFHIRYDAHDSFAKYLFAGKIRADMDIKIKGPRGVFRLNENSKNNLSFIAWDTGFAPIRSVIEHHYDLDLERSTDFYWAYPNYEKAPYLDKHAKSWQDLFDDYHYTKIACDFHRNVKSDCKQIAEQIFANIDIKRTIKRDIYLAMPAHIVLYLSEMLIGEGGAQTKLIAFPM